MPFNTLPLLPPLHPLRSSLRWCLPLSLLAVVGCGGPDAGDESPSSGTPAGILSLPAGWNTISPGGETTCSRGDPFRYFVRPGTVNRLVVEFRGGGACWNATTCAFAGSVFQETVTEDPAIVNEQGATGIYDHENPDNPFRDWHHVYIPYCTGDIHWGDNVATYGEGSGAVTIRHKGAVNVRAALGWIYENVPAPEKVFVTGCSAGAYGSILWSAHLREHYADAPVYQFADSGAGIITDTFFEDSFPSWRPQGAYPTWISGLDPAGLTRLPALYTAIGNHYPDMRLSQYNTAYDEDQIRFFRLMGGGDAAAWSDAMRASVDDIEASTPNFSSYLAPGSDHCILWRPELYTVASGGTRLVAWLDDLVNGDAPPSVACEGDACGAPE
ncbi:pectin acetylesterase-family hydrolase [Sorangium sp. So ce1036]|uniref:pectin acetylesterase-family hydrolase n=1 Tax=Sorangium sp. So ce1036 TaxID=3133328 RepID=UPI003EFDFD90